jgi:hypothetical protein
LLAKCGRIGNWFCTICNLKHQDWNAEIKDAITKVYYFDLFLALSLNKPLQLWCWWLINARIFANKWEQLAMIGQMMLNQYFLHLLSARTVPN